MVEITQTTVYIFWAAAILIFGIAEAVTIQLVSIWFLVGAIAALIAALCGASPVIQIIIFIAVSVLALVITRPFVKKFVSSKKQNTNYDRVIGQIGIVTEDIDNINAVGQVKADGKIWTARSIDNSIIPAGSEVIVDRIDGVKLIVKSK
ncbi:MAG: NfeD family protein [Eubacterium sp.]|nr:NfeD family protein [Eubacterium sp.]MDE6155900.1 NfeD family protein [Eubacterium sp.]MDE6767621.1 NfeD family protein [Eubacterium sp.]